MLGLVRTVEWPWDDAVEQPAGAATVLQSNSVAARFFEHGAALQRPALGPLYRGATTSGHSCPRGQLLPTCARRSRPPQAQRSSRCICEGRTLRLPRIGRANGRRRREILGIQQRPGGSDRASADVEWHAPGQWGQHGRALSSEPQPAAKGASDAAA